MTVRGAAKLGATLVEQVEDAFLFRRIATVDTNIDVGTVDDWCWSGPSDDFAEVAVELGAPGLADLARRLTR